MIVFPPRFSLPRRSRVFFLIFQMCVCCLVVSSGQSQFPSVISDQLSQQAMKILSEDPIPLLRECAHPKMEDSLCPKKSCLRAVSHTLSLAREEWAALLIVTFSDIHSLCDGWRSPVFSSMQTYVAPSFFFLSFFFPFFLMKENSRGL